MLLRGISLFLSRSADAAPRSVMRRDISTTFSHGLSMGRLHPYCLLAFSFAIFSQCLVLCAGQYGRPVVVQIDSRSYFDELDPTLHMGRQFVPMNVNGHHLVCGDVARGATRVVMMDPTMDLTEEYQAVGTITNQTGLGPIPIPKTYVPRDGPGKNWNHPEFHWTPESQLMRYLVLAKTAYLTEDCFLYKPIRNGSTLDICIGRSVAHFYLPVDEEDPTDAFSHILGLYDPFMDEVYQNGTIVQHYTNGTDNRSSTIRFECTVDYHTTVTWAGSVSPGKYCVTIGGPAFCDWRALKEEEENGLANDQLENRRALDPAQLLHDLDGWCQNFTTSGWWTYEYCHPDSLIQFHVDPKTGKMDKVHMYLLGSLVPPKFMHSWGSVPGRNVSSGSGASNDDSDLTPVPPVPNPAFVQLRSYSMPAIHPGDPVRWKLLNMTVVDERFDTLYDRAPQAFLNRVNVVDEPLKALQFELQPGTGCPNNIKRRTIVLFFCPGDFISFRKPQILRIRELSLCVYEVLIATSLLCAHPGFLPQRIPQPETAICYRESRESNDSTKRLPVEDMTPLEKLRLRHAPTHGESEKDQLFFSLASSPELLPSIFAVDSIRSEGRKGIFTLGNYTRSRRSPDVVVPMFRIGDVVRHKGLNITGVIIGWDYEAQAPDEWLVDLSTLYSTEVRSLPFYLILLDESLLDEDRANQLGTILLYSPQQIVERHLHPISNRHVTQYFGTFDAVTGRYTIYRSRQAAERVSDDAVYYYRTFLERYPDDLTGSKRKRLSAQRAEKSQRRDDKSDDEFNIFRGHKHDKSSVVDKDEDEQERELDDAGKLLLPNTEPDEIDVNIYEL